MIKWFFQHCKKTPEPIDCTLLVGYVNIWKGGGESPRALYDTEEEADAVAERWNKGNARIACVKMIGSLTKEKR